MNCIITCTFSFARFGTDMFVIVIVIVVEIVVTFTICCGSIRRCCCRCCIISIGWRRSIFSWNITHHTRCSSSSRFGFFQRQGFFFFLSWNGKFGRRLSTVLLLLWMWMWMNDYYCFL